MNNSIRLPCGSSYKAAGATWSLMAGVVITTPLGLRTDASYVAMAVTFMAVVLNLSLNGVRFDPRSRRIRIVVCGVTIWRSHGEVAPEDVCVLPNRRVWWSWVPLPQVVIRSRTVAQKDRRLFSEFAVQFTGRSAQEIEADTRRTMDRAVLAVPASEATATDRRPTQT